MAQPSKDLTRFAQPLGRRPFLVSLLSTLAVACQQPVARPQAEAPKQGPRPKADESPFTVILPASDLAVGPNRFLLALLENTNRPISNAELRLRFFKIIDNTQATLKGEAQPRFYGSGLGDRGLYVARADFDVAGSWGVEVAAQRDGQDLGVARVSFEVRQQSVTPAVGASIPISQIPTATDPAEVETICSNRPVVDDFHSLSIADAVAADTPFLLLFASPGFCRTQTCGPSLQVVERLRDAHGPRLNYLHVEVFQDPHLGAPGLKPVPAVAEWKLPSEPWLFLVNAKGMLFEKFEGGITYEETAPVVEALLSEGKGKGEKAKG